MAIYIIDSHGTRIYAGESMPAARIRLARMQARSPFAGYRIVQEA